jgi:hypothetical protein
VAMLSARHLGGQTVVDPYVHTTYTSVGRDADIADIKPIEHCGVDAWPRLVAASSLAPFL